MYSNAFWSIDSCLNRAKLLQAKNGKTDAVKSKKVIKNFSIQTSYWNTLIISIFVVRVFLIKIIEGIKKLFKSCIY